MQLTIVPLGFGDLVKLFKLFGIVCPKNRVAAFGGKSAYGLALAEQKPDSVGKIIFAGGVVGFDFVKYA